MKTPRPTRRHTGTLAALAAATLAVTATSSHAQQEPPVLDPDSLTPVAGWQPTKVITVQGQFTDDRGILEIEYRIRGRGGWKSAPFTTEGSASSGSVTATFSFNISLKKHKYLRVEIRARDIDDEESDSIIRRFRWDRYNHFDRPETTTPANNNTDTGGGDPDLEFPFPLGG